MKVDKPISKQQLIDEFKEHYPYLLDSANHYSTEKEMLDDLGYSSIEEWLEDDWGYESEESLLILKNLIKRYFNMFKKDEIYFRTFGEGHGIDAVSIIPYKTMEIEYIGENSYCILCR